jgi:multiple sugar transport system permease protein
MRKRKKLTRPIGQFTFGAWALLAVTVLIPIFYGIYISFLDIKLSSFLPPQFVGFDNYVAAFKAPETWATLRITLAMMILGMLVQIPLGMALALVLHRNLKGSKIFSSILITPML